MKIGCFNIQNISIKKVQNQVVIKQIAQIISNYNIMFILELSDKPLINQEDTHSPVLETIINILNKENKRIRGEKKEKEYTYFANTKQGNNSNTAERIGIIYNNNKNINIKFDSLKIFNESEYFKKYAFIRNPFIVPIEIYGSNYIFIINHISPDTVKKELKFLNDIFNDFYKNKNDKIILMGDYNADGQYLSNANELDNELFNNPNLICLTNNELTNVLKNKCYDRILCSKDCLHDLKKVDNDESYNAYCDVDYCTYLHLDNDKIKKISDHYPIFFEINDTVK